MAKKTTTTTNNTPSNFQLGGLSFSTANERQAFIDKNKDNPYVQADVANIKDTPTPTPTVTDTNTKTDNGFVRTSSSVRDSEFDIANSIKQLTSENPVFKNVFDINSTIDNIKNTFDTSDKLINDRIKVLKQRGEESLSSINDSFDIAGEKLKDTQEKSKATFAVGLANIGGYLGQSASGMGAIKNLEQKHAFEVADLEAKRAAAIQAANDALDDSEFDLAKLALENAKDFETQMQKATQDFFSNTLNLSQEMRQTQEANRKYAIEQTERLIDFSVESGEDISPEDVLAASDVLGIKPELIQGAIQSKRNTKALENASKRTALDIQLISALSKIPKGTYVTIGGKSYEGMDSGDGEAELKDQALTLLKEDIARGAKKTALIEDYGDILDIKTIDSYVESYEDAAFDEKVDSGEYKYDRSGEFYYDAKAYEEDFKNSSIFSRPKKEDYEV